ncbi:MAG TPA: Clp protease N-terminal domain-containing protein [Acidimicrobiia bacterium]|nr:Clp protease N-terminal domain-containing protein [Acidimicrobiia bacterium]
MRARFTPEARRALEVAEMEGRSRHEPRIGTEHLLIGVASLGEPVALALRLTPEALRSALDRRDARAVGSLGIDLGRVNRLARRFPKRRHLRFTFGAKEALSRALRVAIDERHKRIGPTHMLAALAIGGPRDPAVRLLGQMGVDPAEVDVEIRRRWRMAS